MTKSKSETKPASMPSETDKLYAELASECANCGSRFYTGELLPVRDLLQRVQPGEIMPSGECPKCGALCHPVTLAKETSESLRAAGLEASASVASAERDGIDVAADALTKAKFAVADATLNAKGHLEAFRQWAGNSGEMREDMDAILDALKVWGDASNDFVSAIGEHNKSVRVARPAEMLAPRRANWSDMLEQMIDAVTLADTLDTLGSVCDAKAQHIRENWQDEATANAWGNHASALAEQAHGARVDGL